MSSETTPPQAGQELSDWQKARYGDSDATRAALAFYRERGWPVDDRAHSPDNRIYDFSSGYAAALRASVPAPSKVQQPQEARWRCQCGRLERMGVTYCGCGLARNHEVNEVVTVEPVEVSRASVPAQEPNLPPQWNCPYCGYGEYKIRSDWERRAADHIDCCPNRPAAPVVTTPEPAEALFRRALEAVLACETYHDERGHAFLAVPARSLSDLGAEIRFALDAYPATAPLVSPSGDTAFRFTYGDRVESDGRWGTYEGQHPIHDSALVRFDDAPHGQSLTRLSQLRPVSPSGDKK